MRRLVCVAVWLMLAAGARAQSMSVPNGRLPEDVTPTHYRLKLELDPKTQQFLGEATISVTVRRSTRSIWLHGRGLKVDWVTIASGSATQRATYLEVEKNFGVARIDFPKAIGPGPATLTFHYGAPYQDSALGLYRSRVGDDWYVFSQFESTDARRAFPGFDQPRFKTPFDVTVIAPATEKVIANASELAQRTLASGRVEHRFQTTKPLPTYLLALAVGPLDIVEAPPIAANAIRSTPLPLRFVGAKGQGARMRFAMRETPELVRRLEEYFGIAFPYPKLDMIATPSFPGAMENAGAIVFADSLLVMDEVPTARQQSDFGMVAAHEIAHQWFGDLVTPAWWDDVWLNESFAEWLGVKVSDAWRPALGIQQEQLRRTLDAMNVDALKSGRAIHQPVERNDQIDGAFDDITYEKGAGVLLMFESYLGEERFRAGVRGYLRKHMHSTATAADFFGAISESARDPKLLDAFLSFVNQPGVPILTAQKSKDGKSMHLSQVRYHPLGMGDAAVTLWSIPVCVRVYSAANATHKDCNLLLRRDGTLVLTQDATDSVVMPNADGAGYYRFSIDGASLAALLQRVPDLPAREAAALADSIAAAFDAGAMDFNALLEGATALARHPDRTASLLLGDKLLDIHDRMLEPGERPALERALVGIYGPRLREIGYEPAAGRYAGEPAERQLLRRALIRLVAQGGRDAEIRRALADAALKSIADPRALDSSIRSRAWAIGVQDDAQKLAGPLEDRVLHSTDPQTRDDAARALSQAESAETSAKVLDLVLNPRIEAPNAIGLLFGQIGNPRTAAAAWAWLANHSDAVIERGKGIFGTVLVHLGDNVCEPAGRSRFNSILADRLRPLSGGEIGVDQELERIDVCMAVNAAQEASIHAVLNH